MTGDPSPLAVPTASMGAEADHAWADAALVAALVAVDPVGLGGAVVRARPGPARDLWLDGFAGLLPEGTPLRRLPAGIGDDRLLGGLDLAATLSLGRPVFSRGVLAESDGGVVILPMAERAQALAPHLGAALDTGEIRAAREGMTGASPARLAVVALDEGAEPDERIPDALADRLAFRADLTGLGARLAAFPADRTEIAEARMRLPSIGVEADVLPGLVAAAAALGIDSLRAPLLALRTARALAALWGAEEAGEDEATVAARLVLGHRARHLPAEDAPEQEPEQPEDRPEAQADTETKAMEDRVVEAAVAAIPPGLLARLAAGLVPRSQGREGRAGAQRRARARGRPAGLRAGRLRPGDRLDLVATLRAAAPWQRLRQGTGPEGRIKIRAEDFRIRRFKHRSESASVFIVDASGSAAVARMAEAKGAVELLLAEAYVRRDQVALIAFRGTGAEILLPPTRSPALAKKRLAALPGGGGTPLAAGIEAGTLLADHLARKGMSPQLVLLTDGRANIARDGSFGRSAAAEDARRAAEAVRIQGVSALVIDTATRPQPAAEGLARTMGAGYLALPHGRAQALGDAVRAAR